MGFVDLLSSAGEYFKERWNAITTTYGESWANTIPENWKLLISGATTLALSPKTDEDDFGKGLRLFMDGAVGVGGGLLSGTVGGLFQAPVLHELGFLLDKAYRYLIARPLAWMWSMPSIATLNAEDARKRGGDPLAAYLGTIFNSDTFTDRGPWSEEIGRITPGQALVWSIGGFVGAVWASDKSDRYAWLRENDPRTPAGQAKYNSAEADTVLKYTSGTIDLLSVFAMDPGHGAGLLGRAAMTKIRNVSTAEYIIRGGLEKEVNSKHFERLYQLALESKNAEELRFKAFPNAPRGHDAALPLWAAARIDKELFRDAYFVARGLDNVGIPGLTSGRGAWVRLKERAPEIFAAFENVFGNWNIATDAQNLLRRAPEADDAITELMLTDLDSFMRAIENKDGAWGRLVGSLFRTPQPKPGVLSEIREGIHLNIVHGRPIWFLRPFHKIARAAMPSQGWVPFLNVHDRTAHSVNDFRALVERVPDMSPDEVNRWVTLYGSKGTDEGRKQIYDAWRDRSLQIVAERNDLPKDVVEAALPEIGRYQSAARGFIERVQIYASQRAAQLSAALRSRHLPSEGKAIRDKYPTDAASRKGDFGKSLVAVPNVDGKTILLDLSDPRIMPELALDPSRAQLITQSARYIPTIDFRALDASIRYWKWLHRPEASLKGKALSVVARGKQFWDGLITSLDFVNMVWKATTLFRLAQIPRNIADDVNRRILQFDKLPFLLEMMKIPRRTLQNTFGTKPDGSILWRMPKDPSARKLVRPGRVRLAWDIIRDIRMHNQIRRTAIVHADGPYEFIPTIDKTSGALEIIEEIDLAKRGQFTEMEKPRGFEVSESGETTPVIRKFNDLGDAWIEGVISWQTFREALRAWASHPWRSTDVLGIHGEDLVRQYERGQFKYLPQEIDLDWEDRFGIKSTFGSRDRQSEGRVDPEVQRRTEQLKEAIRVVVNDPTKARASELQKMLGLSFSEASLLLDMMQSRGIVSPPKLAKRTVEGEIIEPAGGRDVLLGLDEALARAEAEAQGVSFETYLNRVSEEGVAFQKNRPDALDIYTMDPSDPIGLSPARRAIYEHLMEPLDPRARELKEAPGEKPLRGINLEREYKRKLLWYYFGRKDGGQPHFLSISQTDSGPMLNVARYIRDTARLHKKILEDPTIEPHTGRLVINPLDGSTAAPSEQFHDQYTIVKSKVYSKVIKAGTDDVVNPTTGALALERFILDNLDFMTSKFHRLAISVEPTGEFRFAVVRLKRPADIKLVADVEEAPWARIKHFNIKERIHAGTEAMVFTLPNGNRMEIGLGAFVGDEGDSYRHHVSAVTGDSTANMLSGEYSQDLMYREAGAYHELAPTHPNYGKEWERIVNTQIAGDRVARMFLEGKSENDVIAWLQDTQDGAKYIKRLSYLGHDYIAQVDAIKAIVDDYVPYVNSDAGRALRAAVLNRVAAKKHLDDAVPVEQQAPIHGFSIEYMFGRHAVFHRVARALRVAQRYMFDKPTDRLSRFPFFAEAYRRHLAELVRLRLSAARPKWDVTEDGDLRLIPVQKLQDEDFITTDEIQRLEKMARDRAFYDVKYYLYDVARMNDLARMFRFIVPFSNAIMDSYIKYGRMARENPGIVLQGLYYWETFERNETIQDENGYVLRRDAQGNERWYAVDPETGEMKEVPKYVRDPETGEEIQVAGNHHYVVFRLPSNLGRYVGKKYFGVELQPAVAINKKSFNVFIDLPTTGPFVGIPANHFALNNPEFGEARLIRQFVLPFGPNVNYSSWVPANIKTLWGQFDQQDGNTAEGHAKAIFQAELIAYGRGERDEPPSFVEAREKAGMLKTLRFMSSVLSPVSFQFQSPYQPYIDAYRQLAAVDPKSADEKFLARYGEEFYAVAMTVTRNNAGVRASLKSHASYLRHKELVEKYPDLAGLIVGYDGGAFSKAVYEAQKRIPIKPGSKVMLREVQSLQESVEEVEKRRVWDAYSRLMDAITAEMVERGIRTLRGRAAEDLARLRDDFIEANKYWIDPATGAQAFSPWYQDFTSTDTAMMQKRIEQMWQIVQDPDLQNREDIRGLIEYLAMRERAQEEMRLRGVRTLSNRNALDLARKWEASVFDLVESNPDFAVLWSRWLSRDTELAL